MTNFFTWVQFGCGIVILFCSIYSIYAVRVKHANRNLVWLGIGSAIYGLTFISIIFHNGWLLIVRGILSLAGLIFVIISLIKTIREKKVMQR